MGCCFGRTNPNSGASYTGYVPDAEDVGGCTFGRCMCCIFCCCIYPCIPYKCGGSYPQPLRELAEFNAEQDTLSAEEVDAYNQLQRARIDNHEPIAQGFDDIVTELETGDIVLFQGSNLSSNLISIFTGRWTHVGMVFVKVANLETPDGRVVQNKMILLLESVSHPDGCMDVATNSYKDGVRLVDLKNRLKDSDSPFFGVVKLRVSTTSRRERLNTEFERFYNNEGWKRYEPNKMNLIRVAFDCGAFGHNENDTSTYFCSKLVCEALEHMGVIEKNVNSARVCPTDFWDYKIQLKSGARVQSLIFLPRLQEISQTAPAVAPRRQRRVSKTETTKLIAAVVAAHPPKQIKPMAVAVPTAAASTKSTHSSSPKQEKRRY